MDLQPFWAFFLILCLPTSVYLWAGFLVANGSVRSLPAMPWEFRLAARASGAKRDEGRSGPVWGRFDWVWGLLFLLAFVNLVPLALLVRPYGPISFVSAAAYLLAQLCWLARIRRAVRRINRTP